MSVHGWMTLFGVLFLFMALSSTILRRLPITTSIIYLAVGIAIGPFALEYLRVDLVASSGWAESATEIAVIVSLFVGGLKLRLPLADPAWRAAYRLAGPVMLGTISCVALVSHYLLGLDVGLSLLIGAVLAPTDPVLAAEVSVNDAADHDRMRYGLSGEAGLNDGMAFPFVVLALEWMEFRGAGGWLGSWAFRELLWAIPVGILFGLGLGRGVGRLAMLLRSRQRDAAAPNDFLVLALIALSYVGAEALHAWGFLSVFAAGVGLRHAEVRIVDESPISAAILDRVRRQGTGARDLTPAEHVVNAPLESEALREPSVAAGLLVSEALSFGVTAERLFEVLLVTLVGVLVAEVWDPRALVLGGLLFFVIRPASVYLLLGGTPTSRIQRALMGWFGLRGIGSMYYLSYALQRGVTGADASTAVALTVSVIALSIVMHGTSAQPILDRYERTLARH